MDFEYSQQQVMLKELARDFALREVAPLAAEMDEQSHFDCDLMKKMADQGLLGITFPEEYGGSGEGYSSLVVIVEELARVDMSSGVILAAQNSIGGGPFNLYGTKEQKDYWLPRLVSGESMGGFGLTEPGTGSDARALRTRADLKNGEWVINGDKCFISHAGMDVSEYVNVLALTGGNENPKEISMITVPRGTEGYSFGKKYKKLGWRATDTRELIFQNCRVPEANLLGQRGKGFDQVLYILDAGRIVMGALSVGCAQGCLDQALAYAKERIQFGKSISKYQAIQFKLADMAVEIEAARMLTLKAAQLKDAGKPHTQEAAFAKLFASEVVMKTATQALQIHGGYGYVEEYPITRFFRDARLMEIGEGTSEICRALIARHLGC